MITIKGIRLDSVSINKKNPEEQNEEITASYSLLSSADRVLATQSVGGYQGLKLQPSAETIGKLNAFLESYKKDINLVLGLETV